MAEPADDSAILARAAGWLRDGQRVALVTVLRTWGSSPRPAGSLLAMNGAGRYVGSVSGGCVEDTLVARYRDGEIAGPEPALLDFGVDRQGAARMGLPCGGRLEIVVEHLTDAAPVETVLDHLRAGERICRQLDLASGEVRLIPADGTAEFRVSADAVHKTFGPAWRLLLIGDGQLARHLASMALQLDYRVTICDPRDSFAPTAPLAGVTYTRSMPDDAVKSLHDLARTAIVTLAHDPRQDDLALSAALETNAFYIGALGSSRTAESRCKRLFSIGHTPQQIALIHAPVGLAIGSRRPAEIALSILAEITATRNGVIPHDR